MRKTIYLVRHGETAANRDGILQGWSDFPLCQEGEKQAQDLAARAKGIPLDAIYISDLMRTQQTAAPLAKERNLSPVVLPGLREISFGRWEGRPFAEMKKEDPELLRKLFREPTQADIGQSETVEASQTRVWDAFRHIETHMEDGQTVLAISHGGILRALLCHLLSMPLDAMWRLGLDNTASVKVVCNDIAGYWVEDWNNRGPLMP